MERLEQKKQRFVRRKKHIRKSVFGTADRLRFTVKRTLKQVYAQIINDDEGRTIVSASSLDKDVRGLIKPEMKKIDKSRIVGEFIAKKAIAANIKTVTFDRNGYLYHGRVKALADSARKAGLEF
jgi:large subunit ribosomal protein L18